ncbi:ATP synthase delta chain, chloroplastic-like [Benincasa hispida]|uniref:ATP synthase delta chain, chloroplastic-like n=1 Tax=Benincasa hispida TaxID=102211 RepID=UPI00190264C8|nr:ATP synthase delta chain, chloroplastic-like [Benincasa hispida]
MDTLTTTSVSTLRVPSTLTSSRDLLHLKNPTAHLPHRSPSRTSNSISKPPIFVSTPKTLNSLPFSSPRRPSSPLLHRRPAAGYAAALVDASQTTGAIHSVAKDVGRFSKLLRGKRIGGILNDPLVGEEEKGRLVREIAVKGGFERQVLKLTKMLIEKKKLGILTEVLSEFERIYDGLCGTEVVMVSSSKKMEEEELFGIAKNVQRLSGAVKVKVRSFVHGGLMA